MQESTPSLPPRGRRWLRFGLRTLLFLVVIVAVFAGWFASSIHRSKEQHAAAAEIRRRGGLAMDCPSYRPKEKAPDYCPAWLREKLGKDYFTYINYVSISNTDFTDEDLALLEALPDVRALLLTKSRISDSGLAHVAGLQQLRRLSLPQAQLSDAGIAQLGRLTQLEYLDLKATPISDAGLVHLHQLKLLRRVDLTDTLVTDQGIAALIEALPTLKVIR